MLAQIIQKPMSGEDIAAAVPGVTVIAYGQLNGLAQLPPLPCCILYETSPGFGHWTALLATPEGIEHFDSYGIKPDGELKFVPEHLRDQLGESHPRLTELLLRDGRPVNYSAPRLQSEDPRVATCGRWCCLRIMFSGTGSSKFSSVVKKTAAAFKLSPDGLVARAIPN